MGTQTSGSLSVPRLDGSVDTMGGNSHLRLRVSLRLSQIPVQRDGEMHDARHSLTFLDGPITTRIIWSWQMMLHEHTYVLLLPTRRCSRTPKNVKDSSRQKSNARQAVIQRASALGDCRVYGNLSTFDVILASQRIFSTTCCSNKRGKICEYNDVGSIVACLLKSDIIPVVQFLSETDSCIEARDK